MEKKYKYLTETQREISFWDAQASLSPTRHTDPELQVIVQGLEEGSPWFNKIFGVLFCDYDESQGLLG